MAETDIHRDNLTNMVQTLDVHYADEPMVYVSGNLLLYYVEGDRHSHVSPDVFVVKGVPKRKRRNYLLWVEARDQTSSRNSPRRPLAKKIGTTSSRFTGTRSRSKNTFSSIHTRNASIPRYKGSGSLGASICRFARLPVACRAKYSGFIWNDKDPNYGYMIPKTGERLPTPLEMSAQEKRARMQAEAEIDRLRRELDELRKPPQP